MQNGSSKALLHRLQNRHALHMMRHRKHVVLSTSRKRPGQRHFLESLCNLRAPRASNKRHGRQSALLGAEHTAATRSLRGIRPARELHGPPQGGVELHPARSGMTLYGVWKPRQRMGLYRTVRHEVLRDDLLRYLNRNLVLPAVAWIAHPR